VLGYYSGHNQSHTYATAGSYILTVTVTNKAGTGRVNKDITVLGNVLENTPYSGFYFVHTFHSDPLHSVTINGPKYFPAYTTVTFSCDVQSQNGTDFYTPVTYQWSFTVGSSTFTAVSASVSHHFSQPGHLTITCAATNPISAISNSVQVLIVDCKYSPNIEPAF